jgi:DNA-binding transcriptional LysR family regulator
MLIMELSMQWDHRMRHRLKLRYLDTLLAVAQSKSMAKAATQLSVSQPAVSKTIADLEQTLGVRLLDRTSQGVEPTLYGRALVKWSKAVFDDLRQSINEIDYLSDPTRGELRIGITEPMAAGLAGVVLDDLARECPGIVFRVTQGDPITLESRELRERNIELMLGRIPRVDAGDDLNIEALYDEQIFVCAGANNPWLGRRKIKLSELVDEPWILPPLDASVGSLITESFRAEGLEVPQARIVSFSIQLQGTLLAGGRFLGIASESMLRFGGERLSLKKLPVGLRVRSMPLGIVTLKNRTLSPIAQLFMQRVREKTNALLPGSSRRRRKAQLAIAQDGIQSRCTRAAVRV